MQGKPLSPRVARLAVASSLPTKGSPPVPLEMSKLLLTAPRNVATYALAIRHSWTGLLAPNFAGRGRRGRLCRTAQPQSLPCARLASLAPFRATGRMRSAAFPALASSAAKPLDETVLFRENLLQQPVSLFLAHRVVQAFPRLLELIVVGQG